MIYDIWLDGDFLTNEQSNYLDFHSEFIFGDWDGTSDDNNARGEGKWNYFGIYGHSACRFFDNFQDRHTYNWNEIKRKPADSSIWTSSSVYGAMFVYHSLYLKSNDQNGVCKGQSPFIDYYNTEDYRITFDFKPTNSGDIFVVMSNNEIKLIYHEGFLKYLYSGSWNNKGTICQLNPGNWYFIEIIRKSTPVDAYEVLVNHGFEGVYTDFYDKDNGYQYVEFGDFSIPAYQKNNGAYWDNIRVWSDLQRQVSGFSQSFQKKNAQECNDYILTFFEDFEDYTGTPALDIEEYGWKTKPTEEGSGTSLWQVGTDNSKHSHTGDNIIATVLNGQYPNNADEKLITPVIDLTYFDSATFSYWIAFWTETDHDGFRWQYRSKASLGNPWSPWDDVDELMYSPNVAAFGGPAVTSTNGGWSHWSFPLNELMGSHNYFQFRWHFKSDGSGQNWGLYLDDIKIHGMASSGNDNDFDDDTLLNFEEFYLFKCSPLITDTDGDALKDGIEIENQYLTKDLDFGSAHFSEADYNPADPCMRDIFVEVDSMENEAETESLLTESFKIELNGIKSTYSNHDINIHLDFNELRLDYQEEVDDTDLDLLQDNFDAEDFAHYLIVCYYYEPKTTAFGITWHGWSTSCSAIFIQAVIDQDDSPDGDMLQKTFVHEMGHSLGMKHYYPYPWWWPWLPEYPGGTAMQKGSKDLHNTYLTEYSNTEFEYELEEDDWHDITIGGWEYCMDDNQTPTEWYYGLFYKSIDYST
jgi:hypothetical protein